MIYSPSRCNCQRVLLCNYKGTLIVASNYGMKGIYQIDHKWIRYIWIDFLFQYRRTAQVQGRSQCMGHCHRLHLKISNYIYKYNKYLEISNSNLNIISFPKSIK